MPPVRPATGQSRCAPIRRHTEGSTTDGNDIGCPAFAGHQSATREPGSSEPGSRILDPEQIPDREPQVLDRERQVLDLEPRALTAPASAATSSAENASAAFDRPAALGSAAEVEAPAPRPRELDRRTLDSLSLALTRELGDRNVDHWFRDRTTLAVQGDALVVGVGSTFLAQWMQRQFRSGVVAAARTVLGTIGVRFEVDPRVVLPTAEQSGQRVAAPVVRPAAPDHRGPSTMASVLSSAPRRLHTTRRLSDRGSADSNLESRTVSTGTVLAGTGAASASTTSGSLPLHTKSGLHQAIAPHQANGGPDTNGSAGSRSALCRIDGEEVVPPAANGSSGTGAAVLSRGPATPHSARRSTDARRSDRSNEGAGAERPQNGNLRGNRRLIDLGDVIEGACNQLALTAARQICEAPGARINPLYLHGGVGTGKTVVLEGIARRIRRTFPNAQVMLLTAETFANFFTEALRDKALPGFRQRFRTVDVLLVDDVDFLDGKKVTQEEFLHTFKQLESLGRQVVVTADRHPKLFQKSSDDLITRLLSGLVCRLENPDLETRRRIVASKALPLEAEFAPETLAYVAQRFTGNVRELEGALHSLATWHAVSKKRVTLSAARTILADLERDCVKTVRVGDVEETVCRFFNVSTDELRSPSRTRTVSQPRMLAMFLARKLTQAAYSEIGQHFGGRNHATVMSAERKVREWIADGTTLRIASREWTPGDVLEALEQQLRAC